MAERKNDSPVISTLGPRGTFSHEACLKYSPKAKIIFKNTIYNVFESVKNNEADLGIVPVENSTDGTIGMTLDFLVSTGLKIKDEITVKVMHNLAGIENTKLTDIRMLYCHPQAYAQCEEYIRKNIPQAEIIHTSSNSKSSESVANGKDAAKACITTKLASEMYGLKIIEKNIQDYDENNTRFIVLSHNDSEETGRDKTSVAFYTDEDRPGSLYEILGIFAQRKINLAKIESRPNKKVPGRYIFFMDLWGHRKQKDLNDALELLKRTVSGLYIFGSYPRRY